MKILPTIHHIGRKIRLNYLGSPLHRHNLEASVASGWITNPSLCSPSTDSKRRIAFDANAIDCAEVILMKNFNILAVLHQRKESITLKDLVSDCSFSPTMFHFHFFLTIAHLL